MLIVGAGPAGLALARQLRRRRIDHCIVDQDDAGASWRSMPPALRLVSPWWTNALCWRDVFRHPPFALVDAPQFAAYLDEFRTREDIRVVPGCKVTAIAAHGEGHVVTTSRGQVRSRFVVVCTGYFPHPVGPDPAADDDGSIPVVHAAAYPGPEKVRRLAGGRPVIVVGRRVSAGQIMVELADAGIEVALSTRAPVEFRRDGRLGALKDALYYFYEELLVVLRPRLRLPSFPVMDGGRSRELFEAGRIPRYPPIRALREGVVEFEDGSTLEAGMVVHATGYRPGLPELPIDTDADGLPRCYDWESTRTPGVFFLGLDNRRNYRSRTLRGIRSDCRALARTLQARIDAAGGNSQPVEA
ncbi:hypothetical protein P873_03075 [Arenimonas composti TR7-09 = DSM 18010]|uniref:FAD/NAD(P)-binding domain-containing protein n=1 Tax=Arenimonas composti TR7-09 = DSM 18010 TaxID=1121013 RepID=A0A091BI82_9GAMM|nr:hypothetical protein P873_03075 [Arenimonas composti TR7-09 = DSM 18010]